MAPSLTRLKINAVAAGLGAVIKHFTSKTYPQDWNLSFHIQFAVLRQLLASTGEFTVEDVWS